MIQSSISPDSEAAKSGATQSTVTGNILLSSYYLITNNGEDTRFSSLQAEVHQGFQEVFNRIERRALDQARDARLDKMEIKDVINAEIHAVRTEIREVRTEIEEVKHQNDANKSILGRIKDILQSFVSS
jgi:polyribonucleotide nucleotidyltransferase